MLILAEKNQLTPSERMSFIRAGNKLINQLTIAFS
jgi:hypothetical protein